MRIKVSWVKSAIGYSQRQKNTIEAIGLRRLNHSVVLEDSAAVRGMLAKVRHLVVVEPFHGEMELEESKG